MKTNKLGREILQFIQIDSLCIVTIMTFTFIINLCLAAISFKYFTDGACGAKICVVMAKNTILHQVARFVLKSESQVLYALYWTFTSRFFQSVLYGIGLCFWSRVRMRHLQVNIKQINAKQLVLPVIRAGTVVIAFAATLGAWMFIFRDKNPVVDNFSICERIYKSTNMFTLIVGCILSLCVVVHRTTGRLERVFGPRKNVSEIP